MTFADNACGLRLEYNRVFIWGRGGGGLGDDTQGLNQKYLLVFT